MLLFPKKPKFMKSFSGKHISKTNDNKKNVITESTIVLIANQAGFMTNYQIEALRRYLRKFIKRQGRIVFPNFPMIPITIKPSETRLGRGKGQTRYWVNIIRKNDVLVEIVGSNRKLLKSHMVNSKIKLSLKANVFDKNVWWIL